MLKIMNESLENKLNKQNYSNYIFKIVYYYRL